MSEAVIQVEKLGKRFHIGKLKVATTLRDALTNAVKAAFPRQGKTFGSRTADEDTILWALRDVSFEVKRGEVVGLIGRNGAGKSTLLKLLARITRPTTGWAKIRGRVGSLLEVGTGFHPELSGRENIFLSGAVLGMKKTEIQRKFDEIVAFSEVERFLDTPLKHYSSGMQMRLAFAVAAHLEPEILLVDEVLAVGDVAFQKKCLGKMEDVARHGRTIIFVSHNLAAVSRLTQSCAYLESGVLRFFGATKDAIKRYAEAEENDDLIYVNKDLSKSEKPRIESVELRTTFPDNLQMNNSPLDITIKLHIPCPVAGACLSVQIYDANQINYALLWTQGVDVPICRESGTYVLAAHIPKLRLYMGTYRLRVFFSEPPGGEVFQTVGGICPFEVKMQDNSRLFQWWPNECAYVEECEWSVVEASSEVLA
ncbi:MAG TPA: ABC transporter ATP-binding protein [Terriglobales bacterium]|nr:ABC transporter ATP-binding protein [Terriglobales bacterium]